MHRTLFRSPLSSRSIMESAQFLCMNQCANYQFKMRNVRFCLRPSTGGEPSDFGIIRKLNHRTTKHTSTTKTTSTMKEDLADLVVSLSYLDECVFTGFSRDANHLISFRFTFTVRINLLLDRTSSNLNVFMVLLTFGLCK